MSHLWLLRNPSKVELGLDPVYRSSAIGIITICSELTEKWHRDTIDTEEYREEEENSSFERWESRSLRERKNISRPNVNVKTRRFIISVVPLNYAASNDRNINQTTAQHSHPAGWFTACDCVRSTDVTNFTLRKVRQLDRCIS